MPGVHQTIGTGGGSLSSDAAPQLGGNLDANGHKLTLDSTADGSSGGVVFSVRKPDTNYERYYMVQDKGAQTYGPSPQNARPDQVNYRGYNVAAGGAVANASFDMVNWADEDYWWAADVTATVTYNSGTQVWTCSGGHGMDNGDGPIKITTTGSLPTGVTAGSRAYYVIALTTTTFKLASSRANALSATAISLSGAGSGTHTLYVQRQQSEHHLQGTTVVGGNWRAFSISVNGSDSSTPMRSDLSFAAKSFAWYVSAYSTSTYALLMDYDALRTPVVRGVYPLQTQFNFTQNNLAPYTMLKADLTTVVSGPYLNASDQMSIDANVLVNNTSSSTLQVGPSTAPYVKLSAAQTTGLEHQVNGETYSRVSLSMDNGLKLTGQSSNVFGAFIHASSDNAQMQFKMKNNNTTPTVLGYIEYRGDFCWGKGTRLATNATAGFVQITGGQGAPTGTPDNSQTGSYPLYIDETNSKIYVRIGGTWKSVTVA